MKRKEKNTAKRLREYPHNVMNFLFMSPRKKSMKKFRIVVVTCLVLTLLVFWFCASLLFVKQTSFTVLDITHNQDASFHSSGKLMKGSVYRGEFKSTENYLGILKVRFKDFIRTDYRGEDVLQFRIKKKGSKDWYYLNNYRAGLLENQLLFPFGFPVIDQSKDVNYVYEIESLLGNNSNAVTVDASSSLITGHQLSEREIFGSKKRILLFLYKKTISSFTNPDFLLNSIIFFIPLGIFILLKLTYKKYLQKEFLALFTVSLIAVDLVLLHEVYNGVLLGALIMWVFSIWLYKLESSVSFFFAFLLIVLWLILMLVGIDASFSKFNIWTYIFLTIGILQLVCEERFHPKDLITYKVFFDKIFKNR